MSGRERGVVYFDCVGVLRTPNAGRNRHIHRSLLHYVHLRGICVFPPPFSQIAPELERCTSSRWIQARIAKLVTYQLVPGTSSMTLLFNT